MKLELKHLAGYLPYELKGIFKLTDVVAYSVKEVNSNRVKGLNVDNLDFFLDYCKPILRPLSDLTKEIEVNGKKFVPVNEIGKKHTIYYDIESNIISDNSIDFYDIKWMPYNVFEKLLELHFDIYGLIEKGLAIDINTLNKTNE